jgi:hypothetical protein
MPQPVKLSDALVSAARKTASDANRSIAGQVEHWATLGRAIEGMLTSADASSLKRSKGSLEKVIPDRAKRLAVANAIAHALDTSSHIGLAERVAASDRSKYGSDPAFPGLVVRVDPDGTRTPGRFVDRRFVPLVEVPAQRASRSSA